MQYECIAWRRFYQRRTPWLIQKLKTQFNDSKNRLSQKKLPGKGWEYMVYNRLGQPVLTQDANQRLTNQWTVTKYDALGRVIMTGLWNAGSVIPLSTLQANIYAAAQWDVRNTADATLGYTISSYPAVSSYLSVNYYDDYGFSNITGLPPAFTIAPTGSATSTRGLLTGSKINILGTSNMLWSVSYYDNQGRAIQSYKQHNLGGGTPNVNNYDIVTNNYDFTNAVTGGTRKHYNTTSTTSPVLTIGNSYTYDHMGRKLTSSEQINGGTNVMLSKSDYNEIGQLMTKHLHSATGAASFLQDVSYAYNERGWLQKINDPSVAPTTKKLFSERLNYNSTQYGATPQYNGNIAEQAYNVYISPTPGVQTVIYGYDPMSRLLSGTGSTGFTETGITYDVNGNLLTLNRTGPNAATLMYTYYSSGNSNQLQTVTNGGTPFRSYGVYDANGNAPGDGTGKAFTYNLLNLPQTVTATDLSLSYTYDAAGNKLRKVSNGNPTDYIDGIQYKADGTIDFVQTEEGKANRNGTSYTYEYILTDHLGNNRVTFDQTSGKVGEDDYYPFGLNVHRAQNAGNKYLYNKKELQEELNQYDYGARFYDPVIGRWGSVDPLAEADRKSSTYSFAFNNPMLFVDPDGMLADYYDVDGTYIGNDGVDDKKVKVSKKGEYKRLGDGKSVIYKSTELKGITNEILLAFASAIHQESSGDKSESYAIGNVTMNFIKGGGSRGVPTLEDAVMYDNGFAQGATQENYSDFMKLSPNGQNSKNAVGAAINAIGYSQKLSGFTDFTGGANSWDGVDLIRGTSDNNHRNYVWNSDSKSLLSKYQKDNKGGFDVSGLTYKASGYQISATKIIGKTLFTRLEGGRGEKNQSKVRFKR